MQTYCSDRCSERAREYVSANVHEWVKGFGLLPATMRFEGEPHLTCRVCKRKFYNACRDKGCCSPDCERYLHNLRRRANREVRRGNYSLLERIHDTSESKEGEAKCLSEMAESMGITDPMELGGVLAMTSLTSKCEQCETEFTPKRAGAKFCSGKCRQSTHRARRAK